MPSGLVRPIPHPTNHKRLRFWLRVLELFYIIASFILIVTTAISTHVFYTAGWRVAPSKTGYTVFISCITFVTFLIVLPLDMKGKCGEWKKKIWKSEWASEWPRILVNAAFAMLWIGASVSSFLTCTDLCPNIPPTNLGAPALRYLDICCICINGGEDVECDNPDLVFPTGSYVRGLDVVPATKAFSILLVLSFVVGIVLAGALFWHPDLSPVRPRPDDGQSSNIEPPSYADRRTAGSPVPNSRGAPGTSNQITDDHGTEMHEFSYQSSQPILRYPTPTHGHTS